jgi:hypothetical protein
MLPPRASEWVSILAFAVLIVLAWRHKLDRARQAQIAAIGVAANGITVYTAVILPLLGSAPSARYVRDWIPCLLLLLFYSQAGQFVTRSDVEVEMRLELLDQRWVAPWLKWCCGRRMGAWLLTCLEAAYFSYYLAIPLAVGALYWFGKQRQVDHFWAVVFLASLGSCGTLPVVQTRPPRLIGEKWSECLPCGKLRALNLWILRHGSIQANTIPSAHVAMATACALVLLNAGTGWVGLCFLGIAVGIAFGAVAGRYHYGADAVLGFLAGAAAFLAGAALQWRFL